MPNAQPARIAHVVYRTRRLEEMIAWYGLVFGAKVRHRNPAMAFLSHDGEHHRFALIDLGVVRPDVEHARGTLGVDHVAYTLASATDLLEQYARLKAQGVRPYWCVHHGLTLSMYYADPDGNQMEFQVEACAAPEAAVAFIEGPSFSANPIGVEYDPDDLLGRLRAGASEAELLAMPAGRPPSPVRTALADA